MQAMQYGNKRRLNAIAAKAAIANKTVALHAQAIAKPCAPVNTATMFYVVGLRGAYAMQTGKTVNAKNINVYAVFNCGVVAANYVQQNKMGLYAQVIAQ